MTAQQPREHSVQCRCCPRQTWNTDAVCASCRRHVPNARPKQALARMDAANRKAGLYS